IPVRYLSAPALLLPSLSSSFFFYSPRPHPHLHSFPTRRSSDLTFLRLIKKRPEWADVPVVALSAHALKEDIRQALESGCTEYVRSEEHTSELQSQSNLVCRLLLEKKKKKTKK